MAWIVTPCQTSERWNIIRSREQRFSFRLFSMAIDQRLIKCRDYSWLRADYAASASRRSRRWAEKRSAVLA